MNKKLDRLFLLSAFVIASAAVYVTKDPSIVMGGALDMPLVACTPRARETLLVDGLKVAQCVAENQDLPEPEVLVKCASENVTPEDIHRMFEAQKAATAKAAAKKAGCK